MCLVVVEKLNGANVQKCSCCPYVSEIRRTVRDSMRMNGAPLCQYIVVLIFCWCVCMVNVGVLLQVSKEALVVKKQVDDVLGGAEAWKNVQKAAGMCV